MLRIAVQSKGRLFDDTMNLLSEADIKVSATKRTLLVQSSNFPLEVLYLRDDDIPQSVASGVADIGVVGENEFVERGEDAEIISSGSTARRLPPPTPTSSVSSSTSMASMQRFMSSQVRWRSARASDWPMVSSISSPLVRPS